MSKIDQRYQNVERQINLVLTCGQPDKKPEAPATTASCACRAEAELQNLSSGMTVNGAVGCAINGMGGVGKTAFAVALAHRIKNQYPDGQIYLDLDGISSRPLTAAQIMTRIIEWLNPDENVNKKRLGLQANYRSAINGKRILFLMDNAADEEQLRPLIPPAGCVLIVTSRRRLFFPELFPKDLNILRPEQSRALLLALVQQAERLGEYGEQISALCGHLPLALVLAGGALTRPDMTPREYVRRLSHKYGRLRLLDWLGRRAGDSVSKAFQASRDLLPIADRVRFLALSIFPEEFDVRAAAVLWQMKEDKAFDLLSELVLHNLVQWTSGSYKQHDLIRLFGRRGLGARKLKANYFQFAEGYWRLVLKLDQTAPAFEFSHYCDSILEEMCPAAFSLYRRKIDQKLLEVLLPGAPPSIAMKLRLVYGKRDR